MKILSNDQIREADAYTISNEPIASVDLMERAAMQLMREYISRFLVNQPAAIFAGPGNNGGDGIALARLLSFKGYPVDLFILKSNSGLSPDAEQNFQNLPKSNNLKVQWLDHSSSFPSLPANAILIDALFGSGLSRPLEGYAGELVSNLNSLPNIRIAVDIPSGLFSESNPDLSSRQVFMADHTWCFQFPKLAFLMPENEKYVGQWRFLDIGLHQDFIQGCHTPYYYITGDIIKNIIHPRPRFAHKGNFGHALLMAGSKGKFGAAILAGKACLRSGVGLLTAHIPASGSTALHAAVPEAMVSGDENSEILSKLPETSAYSAIGAGPGLGTADPTKGVIEKILLAGKPLVLDADALNIISKAEDLKDKLPEGSILTPHPGEYIRLFGDDPDHFSRLMRMREIAQERKIIIILKGANTAVADTSGNLWFNSTGNPGMATAGSGDVLTGIILSLLSQGYHACDAAVLGVYLHGLAGDIAALEMGEEGLIAGDIIDSLPQAFKKSKA